MPRHIVLYQEGRLDVFLSAEWTQGVELIVSMGIA
jgi:hypothetical protein